MGEAKPKAFTETGYVDVAPRRQVVLANRLVQVYCITMTTGLDYRIKLDCDLAYEESNKMTYCRKKITYASSSDTFQTNVTIKSMFYNMAILFMKK